MSGVCSILIVDPAARERARLRSLLTDAGYHVGATGNVDGALEIAQEGQFDLILLDLEDPDEVPACIRFREDPATRDLPLFVVTSRAAPGLAAEILDSGADEFIGRPFESDELLARVRNLLRTKEFQDALKGAAGLYLDMFTRMGAAVTSPFHLDEDLARILSHALEAAGARRGRLLLSDPHRNQLEVRAVAGDAPASAHGIGEVVPQTPPPPGVLRFPLIGSGRHLGAIEIDRRGLPRLSTDQAQLLKGLAAQAAMFVENVRLNSEIRRMFLDIIVSLAGAVDAKDAYTHGHTVRVARVSLLLARAGGVPSTERETILLAALLHDVGKIGVPDSVLKKPSRLDDSERDVMRTHPEIGAQMLRHIRPLRDVIPGIRHHHEHWDGSGYPAGLAGDAIPVHSRMILVADAFDALTSDRVYRPGVGLDEALDKMRPFAGRQFDPAQFDALEQLCREGDITQDDCRGTPDLLELLRDGT